MNTGKVETVVADKPFGFISSDEFESDIFFHQNNLEGELQERGLKEGDKVTFEVERTEKGLNATNIQLVDESEEEMPMAA